MAFIFEDNGIIAGRKVITLSLCHKTLVFDKFTDERVKVSQMLDDEREKNQNLVTSATGPCYDHTSCGDDCIKDCPHYKEKV